MKYFICLQAGHQNIKNNCDPGLRGSTGAPGEVEMTVRVRDRLGQILLSKKNPDGSDAFMVQLVDACFNCDPNAGKTDFAFFLAIHGEADVHGKDGGMISAPDPSYDDVNPESRRIADAIRSEYFKNAGIVERPEWVSVNMTKYYMWRALSSKTPCALLECGVVQNAHDKVILADTDRVANAIARGICKAFNVSFDAPVPKPEPTYSVSVSIKNVSVLRDNDKANIELNLAISGKKDNQVVYSQDQKVTTSIDIPEVSQLASANSRIQKAQDALLGKI